MDLPSEPGSVQLHRQEPFVLSGFRPASPHDDGDWLSPGASEEIAAGNACTYVCAEGKVVQNLPVPLLECFL